MEKTPEARDSTAVLTTHTFRVEFGSINNVAVSSLVARWWWSALLPVLVFLFIGLYVDIRWLFLIPIFACLIITFAGVLAFIAQTADARLAQSTRPHYVVISDNGIDVVPVADDMPKDSRMPYSIAAEEVADTSISGRNIVVHMHDRSFMLIPLDAADDRMALIDAVDSLVKTQE